MKDDAKNEDDAMVEVKEQLYASGYKVSGYKMKKYKIVEDKRRVAVSGKDCLYFNKLVAYLHALSNPQRISPKQED